MPDFASALPPTLSYLPPPVPELPARLVCGAQLLPDRNALVDLLPKHLVVAEVGVALGYFSRYALDVCAPSRFIAIDTFQLHELPEFWGRKPAEYFGGQTHADWYRDAFATEVADGRMQVMEGDSVAMLEQLEDASVVVFYLDADHRYEWVKRELDVVVRKVRPDGYIIMDDYILVEHLQATILIGVIYATHEFMLERDWAMHYLVLQTNGFYQVVLRRADQPTPARRQVGELERQVAELRRESDQLRTSTSWRVTAPLRAIGSLLRRQPLGDRDVVTAGS